MIIARYFPETGGMEIQCRQLCRELQSLGVKVWILTRNYHHGLRKEQVEGSWVFRSPTLGQNRVINSLIFIVTSLFWLFLLRKKYQIIHCHQSYSPMTIGVAAGMVLKKRVFVKMTASNEYGEVNELKRLPFFRFRKAMMRKVHRFFVVNPAIADELKSIGVTENLIQWIPNGVYLPVRTVYEQQVRMECRLKKGIALEAKVVVFTGRFSEEKNLNVLLRSFQNLTKRIQGKTILLLVGAGGDYRNVESQLKLLTTELKLNESVIFTGKVDDVSSYLLCSDVFALPSVSEGMSNSLLEAMAYGLPCVVTDIPANRCLIEPGTHGILVPVGSQEGLCQGLERILGNPTLAEMMGRRCRERIEKEFSMRIVAEKIMNAYQT